MCCCGVVLLAYIALPYLDRISVLFMQLVRRTRNVGWTANCTHAKSVRLHPMPIVEPPRQSRDPLTATQPEWKLFQSLKKQGGGVSVLLIFTFALLIYSLYHYDKNSVYCNCYEVWLGVYTAALLMFRIIHHVSVLRWQRAIENRNDRKLRAFVNLFVYCHKILIPVLFILIVIGFCIVSISLGDQKGISTCLPPFAIALLEFLLFFAMVVLCLKIGLMHGMYYSNDLSYMTRTCVERTQLTPQFLQAEDGSMDSRTIILSCPVVKACEVMPRENIECVICLERISKEHPVRNFPCGHFFHLHCIDKWLKNHSTCPLCVAKVRQSSANIDVSDFRSHG